MKVSPHVKIYKFPITALTSITNRITGVFCSGLFLGGGIVNICDIPIQTYYYNLSSYHHIFMNTCVSFPFVYHTFGGIRHFLWDAYPTLIQNTKTTKSSWVLIGGSFIASCGVQYMKPIDYFFDLFSKQGVKSLNESIYKSDQQTVINKMNNLFK